MCRYEDGHQKYMCSQEIGLHAQNMLTILYSIVHMIVGTNMITNDHKNFQIDYEEDIHGSSKHYEANGYGHNLDMPVNSH